MKFEPEGSRRSLRQTSRRKYVETDEDEDGEEDDDEDAAEGYGTPSIAQR